MSNCTKSNPILGDFNPVLNIFDSNINTFAMYHDVFDLAPKSKKYKIKPLPTTVKVFEANLSFTGDSCPVCGTVHPKIYVKDTKKSYIKMPSVSGMITYLLLNKTRYKCLSCNKTFTPQSSLTNYGCFISNKIKDQIAIKLAETLTIKYIAREHNVSSNTVIRELDRYDITANHKTFKNYLPEVLHFDEFKSTKDALGNMSFVMLDGGKREILDIVENRQLSYLLKYFSYYTKQAKDNVKFIIIDIYVPYMQLIKEIFPNVKLILDRFHIVQNLTRAFNKTRIKIMNTSEVLYSKIKSHWKILLQAKNKLSYKRYKNRSFNYQWLSNKERVDYLLSNNKELDRNYQVYQDVLMAFQYRDKEKFIKAINQDLTGVSDSIKSCLKTFRKYLPEILNSLEVPYNNGVLEGKISKIKKLKSISCGFRKFSRMKTRIMMIEKLIKVY